MQVISKDHNTLFADCQERFLKNRREIISEMYNLMAQNKFDLRKISANEEMISAYDSKFKELFNQRQEIVSEMYSILHDYYCNLFIHYTHEKGLFWHDDEIRDKAHEASSRLVERFINNHEFKVELSLTAYGHWEMTWVLYHDKDYEMNRVSFDSLIDNIQGKENK